MTDAEKELLELAAGSVDKWSNLAACNDAFEAARRKVQLERLGASLETEFRAACRAEFKAEKECNRLFTEVCALTGWNLAHNIKEEERSKMCVEEYDLDEQL